jgi:hypothetical protein
MRLSIVGDTIGCGRRGKAASLSGNGQKVFGGEHQKTGNHADKR